jgi:hypothetical protein
MPSVWFIMCTDTKWQHIWYLQNKCLLYDSPGVLTLTDNVCGTYKTNAFCMTHHPYRHQPQTYWVLKKHMPSEWLIRHTNTNWQHAWYLQHKCLLNDSPGIQTPTDNILGTYKTNILLLDLYEARGGGGGENRIWRIWRSSCALIWTLAKPLARCWWNYIYEVYTQSYVAGVIFIKIVSGTVLLYLKT